MLRQQPSITETGLDVARELLGLIIFAAVCGCIYQMLVSLAAQIRPVMQ